MKFPLRLTVDLWRSRVSHLFASGDRNGTIFHLRAALLPALHKNGGKNVSGENGHSAAESVRAAAHTAAAVLWIGGSEPLEHSEVGRVAFALNGKGRNVFLHTDGQRLRQRIHEFHPDPRLFLTVEIAGREASHDRSTGRPGAFRRVIEGIRAAKLSGFHVCAHLTVHEKTEVCETGELFELLDRYDVDGYIVSSGDRTPPAHNSATQERLEEIRALVRCGRWESFSRLLEASYASRSENTLVSASVVPVAETETVEETV
jgi:sulfatase maturation enzyme AslB (radical SAM superfamily)